MSQFTPVLANFTEADVQAIEKERERERKRSKRNTRGRRGIVLPDREPLKTMRTLLHPTVDPNAAPFPEPVVSAPVISSTRRAAAIAAQANITVSLQDLPLPDRPQSPPQLHNFRNLKKQSLPRFSRGASRASPSSTREGSVVNGDHTPLIGFKRNLREDSEDVVGGSPLPPRKRHNGRVADSPDLDDVKFEDSPRGSQKPATPVPAPVPIKQWNCKNCGVPETLAGVKMKDMNGQLDLCAKCGNYLQRTGRKRNVEYNEDEEYHRLRVDSNPGSGENSPAPVFDIPIASPKRRSADESDSSSSGSDSDSDDYDAAQRKRKMAKLAAAKATTPAPAKKGATPAPATPATPVTPHQGLPHGGPQPPAWAGQALQNMQQKYPDSRFSIILKARPPDQEGEPQWRVKCLDCPGKIYTLGPGETLDNFEAHAKYRSHNQNVQARLQGNVPGS